MAAGGRVGQPPATTPTPDNRSKYLAMSCRRRSLGSGASFDDVWLGWRVGPVRMLGDLGVDEVAKLQPVVGSSLAQPAERRWETEDLCIYRKLDLRA